MFVAGNNRVGVGTSESLDGGCACRSPAFSSGLFLRLPAFFRRPIFSLASLRISALLITHYSNRVLCLNFKRVDCHLGCSSYFESFFL
jgi:hypothetical protein